MRTKLKIFNYYSFCLWCCNMPCNFSYIRIFHRTKISVNCTFSHRWNSIHKFNVSWTGSNHQVGSQGERSGSQIQMDKNHGDELVFSRFWTKCETQVKDMWIKLGAKNKKLLIFLTWKGIAPSKHGKSATLWAWENKIWSHNNSLWISILLFNQQTNHVYKAGEAAGSSSVKNGIGFVGAGRRPMLSTLSFNFGGGLAGFGNNLPFFSNHSGLSKALNPNLL